MEARSRATNLLVVCVSLLSPMLILADDDENQVPEDLRGTWVFRLYSEDGGKNYKSGGNQPLCEVSAKEIKLLKERSRLLLDVWS